MTISPEVFLILRRDALLVAQRRVFSGSQEPIPELPSCPGFYEPRPRSVQPVPLSTREHSASPRDRHGRIKAVGNLPVGQIVPTFFGNGVILGYICSGDGPMAFVPPNTPLWQVSGGRVHSPSIVNRYAIQTMRNGHPWFLFSKAVTLERIVAAQEAHHA
jgi:hypothetical protein